MTDYTRQMALVLAPYFIIGFMIWIGYMMFKLSEWRKEDELQNKRNVK